MADPVWYYARGDVEKGPLSTAQIKALAAAGRIRPDDYVWKEGMDNWLPAGDVQELLPIEAPKPKERDTEDSKRGEKPAEAAQENVPRERRRSLRKSIPRLLAAPPGVVRLVGRWALLIGVLAVVLARGCDSLGERNVARLHAIASSAENRFQADWEQTRQKLQDQMHSLQSAVNRSPDEQQKLDDLNRRIVELDEEMRNEETRRRASHWRNLQSDAELADESNRMWGFWREVLFQLGSLLLAAGSVAVAYHSDGPERWICLVVLAVIVYSVYTSRAGMG